MGFRNTVLFGIAATAAGCRLSLPGYGVIEFDDGTGFLILIALLIVGSVITLAIKAIHGTVVGMANAWAKKRTLDSEAVALGNKNAVKLEKLTARLDELEGQNLTVRIDSIEQKVGSAYRG